MIESFGEQLQKARKANFMTLKDLSYALNISISYLSDIEHDRKRPPSLDLVSKMEKQLNITDIRLLLLANKIRGAWESRPSIIKPQLNSNINITLSDEDTDNPKLKLNGVEIANVDYQDWSDCDYFESGWFFIVNGMGINNNPAKDKPEAVDWMLSEFNLKREDLG